MMYAATIKAMLGKSILNIVPRKERLPMSKLVICEKPSVAQSVGKVLGAVKRCDGYLEGAGFCATEGFSQITSLLIGSRSFLVFGVKK